jgi:regulator of sigma E protease
VLITIVSLIATLSILILVHEFGHFFAAKAVGIQVPRFSLGFGKRLAGFHWGETEFVLAAIPLGGYVKMAGMEDDEASSALEGAGPPPDEVDPERTFDAKPLWARTLVISAGVVMNLGFAFLLYTGLALTQGKRIVTETRLSVAGVAQNPAAVRAGFAFVPEGARLVEVAGRPVRAWNDAAEALDHAPAGPTRLRFADAAPVTVTLPRGSSARIEALQGLDAFAEPVLQTVQDGSPAHRAGLRAGDRVTAVGGRPIVSWQQLVMAIQGHPGKPLALTVARGGRTLSLTVTPNAERSTDGNGERVMVGKIGAGIPQPAGVDRRVGVREAVASGARETWGSAAVIGDFLKRLLSGEVSPRNMGGLLSIGQASGETAQLGFAVWLGFLAFFSVNLAVINLLPIPILDGGHLMFLAFEAVRGRPLSVEARIRLSQVGLVIVVALMLWANGNDVVRLLFRR